MKTRTYDDLCKTCGGTGMMRNPSFGKTTGDALEIICKVCHGTGVVTITETDSQFNMINPNK